MADQQNKQMLKKVGLKYEFPEDVHSQFATNMAVQHQADFFTLSFFEASMPLLLPGQEKELEKLESVEAKCVAKIIVTPPTMRMMVKVLNENITNYESLMKNLPSTSQG